MCRPHPNHPAKLCHHLRARGRENRSKSDREGLATASRAQPRQKG